MEAVVRPSMEAHDLLRYLLRHYVKKADHVLEVGAGSGQLLREVAQLYHAFGCATDPYLAERDEDTVCFRALKSEELFRLQRRFDLIFTVHALHHFLDVEKFVQSLGLILSWTGTFVLVDWKQGADTGIPEAYFSREEARHLFTAANFRILAEGETNDNFYLIATLRNRRLAVAVDESGKNIYSGMFGRAPQFAIFETGPGGTHFLETRSNPYQKTLQHNKTWDVYRVVADCPALLAGHIGRKGQERLKRAGVRLFFDKGVVTVALKKLLTENKK